MYGVLKPLVHMEDGFIFFENINHKASGLEDVIGWEK